FAPAMIQPAEQAPLPLAVWGLPVVRHSFLVALPDEPWQAYLSPHLPAFVSGQGASFPPKRGVLLPPRVHFFSLARAGPQMALASQSRFSAVQLLSHQCHPRLARRSPLPQVRIPLLAPGSRLGRQHPKLPFPCRPC